MNRDYITEAAPGAKKQRRIHKIHNTYITLLNPLPKHIDIEASIAGLKALPSWMFDLIDGIYIGKAQFFDDKHVEATYIDGSIYVTSELEHVFDLANNILHELAHAAEARYRNELYSDGSIEEEFLKKRKHVFQLLNDYNIETMSFDFWNNTEYNEKFDNHLMNELTYERIDSIAEGVLSYPYAITDIHEYFATAFEIWFNESPKKASQFHPVVAKKIEELFIMKGENHNVS